MTDAQLSLDETLNDLAKRVGDVLFRQKLMLTTAESCTGGWVAQTITEVAGSSGWFERGFVTYSNDSKQEMLGVSALTLESHGAVSEATVSEMAKGALQNSHAQVALAISGIAGPDGGSEDKPVGTVCFAWASKREAPGVKIIVQTQRFEGGRRQVRHQAVVVALQGLLRLLNKP